MSVAAPEASSRSSADWPPVLCAIALGLAAILAAHGETVSETVTTWNRSGTYKFAWAVLPTFAYLLWRNRRQFAFLIPLPSGLGIVAALASAAAWLAGDLLNIVELRQLALVGAIWSVVLAAVGASVFKALAPMLSILVFLVPTGGFLLAPLKHAAVGFAQGFAAVAGVPFQVDGYSMIVGTQRYVVIDYCAGLPYVLIGLFLGLTLGLLIYRSLWKVVALALLGGGLAILANGLRIIGIIAYDYATGSELTLGAHAYFELPALGLSYAILFFIFARLAPEPATDAVPGRQEPAAATAIKCAGSVLFATVLISAAPYLWQEKTTGGMPAASGTLPAMVAGWERGDSGTDWHPRALAETVRTSIATYGKEERRVSVFAATAIARRDKISGGAIDLVGEEIWMPAVQRQIGVCADGRCYDVRYMKLLLRGSERARHVYSVYAVGSDSTISLVQLRLRRALTILGGTAAPATLLAIATEDEVGLASAEIAALVHALLAPRPI